MDEAYRKARKMDTDRFSPLLLPDNTDLVKIVRDYLLEGTQSTLKINAELYKLNVYSMHLIHTQTWQNLSCYPRSGVILHVPRRYST
jgi:hypothetical protein